MTRTRPRRWDRAGRAGLPGLLLAAAAAAQAQKLPPSPAERAEAALPVRVVCIADSPEAFLRDDALRERVLQPLSPSDARGAIRPLGVRYVVPLGAGFVVDPERRHVVTSWHAVTSCTGSERGANGRHVAVLEPGNPDAPPLLGERLPDRTFQDAAGQPVQLVQALCRDRSSACDAELPHGPEHKPLPPAERRRQLDNLLAYAPDLAVLRLQSVATTPPLALALNQQLDDQMRLVVRAFGSAAEALQPASVPALYTGPQQFSSTVPEGSGERAVHARLHRLAMPVQPAGGGAPVLRGDGVVGVLTVMLDKPAPPGDASGLGTGHAVPVTVLASFLDLLKVPYRAAALELPTPAATAATAGAAPAAPADAAGGLGRRWPLLVGAVLLAGVATGAFVALARRQRRVPPPPTAAAGPTTALMPQRTLTRHNPTLLHAVAMPTAAVEPVPGGQPEVHLRCSAGPLADALFTLPMPNGGCTLYVGRDPKSCQVVFPAALDHVSAVHACFSWDPPARALTLRDLSSSGTWVNGARIDKGRTLTLADGDRVDLGGPEHNRFTIDIPAGEETPP